MTQIRTPKCNPGLQICTETQTRTCRDDLHSAVGLLGDLIQLCNKPTTSTKEGRETWAGKIAQTKSMNTFADQTYLEGTPNGHHILPPFQPPKIGPLNCHICQHQHSGNLHTKSEREKKDVCNIYAKIFEYIWIFMHVCIRGYPYISTHIYA